MEVLNLSTDDNEADTSQDELEEDEDALASILEVCVDGTENGSVVQSSSLMRTLNASDSATFNEFESWKRPHISSGTLLYSSSVLEEQPEAFQFFMIDSVSTLTGVKHPKIVLDPILKDLALHNVVRLFGVVRLPKIQLRSNANAEENFNISNLNDQSVEEEETFSVPICCNVHGFVPYFYAVPIEPEFEDKIYWTQDKIDELKNHLNDRIRSSILQDLSSIDYHEFVTKYGERCVLSIEVIDSMDEGIYHLFQYRSTKGFSFVILKIHCSLSRFIWKAHKILDNVKVGDCKFQCYESNINNNLRFLASLNIPGCSWLEVKSGKYYQRSEIGIGPTKETHCQIEIDTHFKDISILPNDHFRYTTHPPIRVLSFDIEVLVGDTIPKDGNQQVIQIGNVLGNYCGRTSNLESIIGKVVFVLGKCDMTEKENTKFLQFYVKEQPNNLDEEFLKDAESQMLISWRDFVILMDPDLIIGYNIKNFDLPYLIDRANLLHKSSRLLPFLGRMKKIKSRVRPVENEFKKVYPHDEVTVNIQGRIVIDLYPMLVRHDKRTSGKGQFTLSSVAKRYLQKGEEKQDVHYSQITGLQQGSPTTRKRLADYCLQDSMIPYLLLFEPTPCHAETIRLIELYFKRSHNGGNLLRYLVNKSMSYNDYFKQVRLQKNPGKVFFVPDTPSPKKFWSSPANSSKSKFVPRKLFYSNHQEQE